MSKIAFLGLGHMGTPMAARLANVGHEVTVWDRSPDHMASFAAPGASAAASPAGAAAGVDFAITNFSGNASVLETYISYLRHKVDGVEPHLIQTVRGIGYSLRLPRSASEIRPLGEIGVASCLAAPLVRQSRSADRA